MATEDLTDREVAATLHVHARTVQRWCYAGKLEGAYKAGRSWRIPRAAIREAQIPDRVFRDDDAPELARAAIVCVEIRGDLNRDMGLDLTTLRRTPPGRDWHLLAGELKALEEAVGGLSQLAEERHRIGAE